MDKTVVEVVWTPAMNVVNQVQFMATIVQSFNMIWMTQSSIIAVGGWVVPPVVPPPAPGPVVNASTPANGGVPTETPLFEIPSDDAGADTAKARGSSSTIVIILIVIILLVVASVFAAIYTGNNNPTETSQVSTPVVVPMDTPMESNDQGTVEPLLMMPIDQEAIEPAMANAGPGRTRSDMLVV